MVKFTQIVGGALLGAVLLDLKSWATAEKGDDGKYPAWDWSSAIRNWTNGLITGISATGIVAASQ